MVATLGSSLYALPAVAGTNSAAMTAALPMGGSGGGGGSAVASLPARPQASSRPCMAADVDCPPSGWRERRSALFPVIGLQVALGAQHF